MLRTYTTYTQTNYELDRRKKRNIKKAKESFIKVLLLLLKTKIIINITEISDYSPSVDEI